MVYWCLCRVWVGLVVVGGCGIGGCDEGIVERVVFVYLGMV